jgi:triphosphatase
MKHAPRAYRPALNNGSRRRLLARAAPDEPVKANPAMLRLGMSAADAFRVVMRVNLAHLQANAPGVREGRNPEYLHQMRVALRRLRSALGVFAPIFPREVIAPVRDDLKWLARRLGPARDWDVFVTETLPAIEAKLGPHSTFKYFISRCEALRRSANRRAARSLRSPRYRRLVLQLEAWLAPDEGMHWPDAIALPVPVEGYASAVLERRYGQVASKGRKLAGMSSRDLHRLRIAVKKYRYAAGFFATLYNTRAARDALRRLSGLQDILGALNDAAIVAGLMEHGFGSAPGGRVKAARALVLGWSRGRAATLKRELKSAWKAFRSAGTFW